MWFLRMILTLWFTLGWSYDGVQVDIKTDHCSEQFLFRKFFEPKINIPKDRYSERLCFNIHNFGIMTNKNNDMAVTRDDEFTQHYNISK